MGERFQAVTGTLKLTRAQRAKLFAGDVPNISGKGKCPVEKGYVLNLSTKVSLEVLRVIPTQNGWRLHYLLRDTRSPVHNLRRTPGIGREDFDAIRRSFEFGYPKPPTQEEIDAAAIESAYTAVGAQVSDAGEGVDQATLKRIADGDLASDAQRKFDRKRSQEAAARLALPPELQLRDELEALRLESPGDAWRYEAQAAALARRIRAKRMRRAA